MIENFKDTPQEFRDYDSELLLKILIKTSVETKKMMIKNYFQMKSGKLIQKIWIIKSFQIIQI